LAGDWLTIYNPDWSNQTSDAVDDYQQLHTTGDNLTLYGMDSSSMQIFEGTDNLLLEDFDVGPCHYNDLPGAICTPRLLTGVGPTNVTLRNGRIHHQSSDDTPGACGSDTCHTVGLALFNGTNILIDRVRFDNNKTVHIRIQDRPTENNSNVTIQNSWFSNTWSASANPTTDNTGTVEFSGFRLANIDVDTPTDGLLIQFNTFLHIDNCGTGVGCGGVLSVQDTMGESGSPAIVRGNLISGISNGSCAESTTTVSYEQNIIWPHSDVNGPSGATGSCLASNTFKAYNFNMPITTNAATASPVTGGNAVVDYHITGAGWDGDSKVTSNCIATDYDGDARSSPCDAGSDER
jgi:hypothetical protein